MTQRRLGSLKLPMGRGDASRCDIIDVVLLWADAAGGGRWQLVVFWDAFICWRLEWGEEGVYLSVEVEA